MAQSMRFGRRITLPSTRQIIHELRVMALRDELRRLEAAELVLNPDVAGQLKDPSPEPA